MNSQIPEFTELPPDVRLQNVELEVICPILADIVKLFAKRSPESFDGYYLACAIALVSIISARRVEFWLGERRATNLYIMLVDTSGLSAKTSVLKLVRAVLEEMGLDFLLFPDTITASKLFSEMCLKLPENFQKMTVNERNKIIKSYQHNKVFIGQRGWIYDEFGNLMRDMMQKSHYNSDFRELLKRLYDNQVKLGNSTQARDLESAQYPFLTLLGGMTPDDLSPHTKKGSSLWRDGFLSRIVFICPPEDFRKDVRYPQNERNIPKNIITKLQQWHNRLGVPQIRLTNDEFKFIPATGHLIEIPQNVIDAFYAFRYALKDLYEKSEEKDLVGSYLRYPEMALRIAVLIASLNNENQVSLDYWSFAQNTTEDWRRYLHWLYYETLPSNSQKNSSYAKDPTEKIHNLIKEHDGLTSREIQQKTRYKAVTVDALLEELLLNKKIKTIPSGKKTLYDDEGEFEM